MKLRDYQQKWVQDVSKAFSEHRAILGVLPTGAGKTVCFSSLTKAHTGYSAAVVHRKEIVAQIAMALAQIGVEHRIIAPVVVINLIRRKQLKKFGKSWVNPEAKTGVASVQTLTSRSIQQQEEVKSWVEKVTFCVFDEGHHYTQKGSWGKAVEMMKNAQVLFVTATPERADGKGLGASSDGFAEILIEGPNLKWLIDQGYLCDFVYKAPSTNLDLKDIPITASGELNTRVMRLRIVDSHLVGDVVEHYKKYVPGKSTIVFANDVTTSEEISDTFNKNGIKSVSLSGETEQSVRINEIESFENKGRTVVSNVDLFDEGLDIPGAEVAILARATESLAKFLQMIGRVLRPVYAEGFDLSTRQGRRAAIAASSKPVAYILDLVRNWERHGMPDWPRVWTLSARSASSGNSEGKVPQRVCLECTQPYEKFHLRCPHCGATPPEPQQRKSIEQVDGDLEQLDREQLNLIFEKIRLANLSDQEYKEDQVRRGIPSVGRRRDLIRHQQAREKRSTLKNLIGWWVGVQQQSGRDIREIQKRFFLRFQVDLASAEALKLRETEALIDKITQSFTVDMEGLA